MNLRPTNEHDDTLDAKLDRLEKALTELRLTSPPSSLDDRVDEIIDASGVPEIRRLHRNRRLGGLGAIVAACLLVAASVAVVMDSRNQPRGSSQDPTGRSAQVDSAPAPEPLRMEQELSNVNYEGTLEVDDGPPVRVFRTTTVRKVWLVDEADDVRVEITTPSEQVCLVRADVH
jgi:hypothetical protein